MNNDTLGNCIACRRETGSLAVYSPNNTINFLCYQCRGRHGVGGYLFTIRRTFVGETYRYRITNRGLDIVGVDFGAPLEIINHLPEGGVILKVKGHTGWGGIGLTTYYETTYYLAQYMGSDNIRFLYSCEPGRYYKRAIQALSDLAYKLRSGELE